MKVTNYTNGCRLKIIQITVLLLTLFVNINISYAGIRPDGGTTKDFAKTTVEHLEEGVEGRCSCLDGCTPLSVCLSGVVGCLGCTAGSVFFGYYGVMFVGVACLVVSALTVVAGVGCCLLLGTAGAVAGVAYVLNI